MRGLADDAELRVLPMVALPSSQRFGIGELAVLIGGRNQPEVAKRSAFGLQPSVDEGGEGCRSGMVNLAIVLTYLGAVNRADHGCPALESVDGEDGNLRHDGPAQRPQPIAPGASFVGRA